MKYLITTILVLQAVHTNAQVSDSASVKLLQQESIYWQANVDSVRFMALMKKANIYRNEKQYNNALHELFRAEKYCSEQKKKSELKYEKMTDYFLSDQYGLCSEIVFDSSENCINRSQYVLMRLYALNETEQWSECKKNLLNECDPKDSATIHTIQSLPVSYNYKSPEKSKKLSAFMPGLGETYAGYPFKGLTSFVLNGSFMVFAVYNIYTGYYITSAVSGIFPLLKFHSGGMKLSSILADEHNTNESGKIKTKYREEISTVIH